MVERSSGTRIAEPRVTKRSARHLSYCSSLTCSSHVDGLAVQRLLDRDVRHRRRRRRAVPVLLAGREPDHVARPDLLDRPAPALRPAEPSGHDQRLAQRMRVPGRAGAGLEGDAGAARRAPDRAPRTADRCRTVPVKYSAGPRPDGCEPLRLISIGFSFADRQQRAPAYCDEVSGREAAYPIKLGDARPSRTLP